MTFPSRYWCTIGLRRVFSLGGWSRRIHTGFHVPRATQGSGYEKEKLRVRGCHPLWPNFPDRSARFCFPMSPALQPRRGRNPCGLGCSPVARHYWGNHSCFLFLQVLRCFSSLRLPPCSRQGSPAFSRRGCPIRTSADQRSHAPTRGFSQLAASFFAFRSQGIRRTPFPAFCLRRCFAPHVLQFPTDIPVRAVCHTSVRSC